MTVGSPYVKQALPQTLDSAFRKDVDAERPFRELRCPLEAVGSLERHAPVYAVQAVRFLAVVHHKRVTYLAL